jgi:hypothetical protein
MVTADSGPARRERPADKRAFWRETPNLYRPLGNTKTIYAGLACSPCATASNHRKSACNDNVCMQAISVEQVFAAVTEVLTASAQKQLVLKFRAAARHKNDGTRLSWGFIGDLSCLLLATSVSTLQAHCGKRVVALTPAHHSG